ncbi:MAG: helix-turn-helix transcriptional regulator [Clostridia bacterium]|nr:helix-turn-helix transcriptional regulator [Clostridia bacterium]
MKQNIFIQHLDKSRYAEITKPMYQNVQSIPLSVENCGTAQIVQHFKSVRISHRGFVCMYMEEGSAHINIDGQTIFLPQNTMLCYRAHNSSLDISTEGSTCTYKWVDISGDASLFYYREICREYFPNAVVFSLSHDIFQYYYDRLRKNLFVTSRNGCYKNAAILTEFLSVLLEKPDILPREESKYARNFARLFSYMEKNYFNPLTIDELAKVFGCSKYHFIRLFQEYTDVSPMKYLCKLRVSRAAESLLLSDRSVEEISEIVGYNASSHFIRYFKELMGMTPLQYRKMYKK